MDNEFEIVQLRQMDNRCFAEESPDSQRIKSLARDMIKPGQFGNRLTESATENNRPKFLA